MPATSGLPQSTDVSTPTRLVRFVPITAIAVDTIAFLPPYYLWRKSGMTTRRHFLKMGAATAATSIVFCGCGLLHRARGEPSARQKLPVTIGGKRIKTIDVHAHCQFPEAVALFSAGAAASSALADGRSRSDVAAAAYIEIDKRLASMDEQAVDL